DAPWVGFGVSQRKRRAPGAAAKLPGLDAEMVAQALHIGNEVPGCVLLERGIRGRAPASALIEEHDAVACRVVIAPHGGVAASAWSAVDHQGRLARRGAALLEIDVVAARDLK